MVAMGRWIGLAFALVIASAGPVLAGGDFRYDHSRGWYVAGFVGGPLPIKQDYDLQPIGSGSYDPDLGLGLAGGIGYRIDRDWRVELTGSWVRAYDGVVRLNGAAANFNGHTDVLSMLVSVQRMLGSYGTHFGEIRPFVGAGIGFTHFDIEQLGGPFTADPTDTVFTAALSAGYDLRLSDRVSFTSVYTLAHTGEARFQSVIPGISTVRDARFDHLFHSGIRIDLN